MRHLRFAGVFGVASVLGIGACSAGGSGGTAGSGNSGAGTGAGGTAAQGGFANGGSVSGSGGGGGINVGDGGGGKDCQVEQIRFDPKIPTVFMLVDRSGSMFETSGGTTNAWQTLRTGALQVIQSLEADVRFGFGAYAAFDGMCPDMPTITPQLNNFAAISGLYSTLERPTSGKIDTGSSFALSQVGDLLWADTAEGEKYILFVTDGEPDYCDDPNPACPVDSVVGTIQRLYAGRDAAGGTHPPIGTIVFGLGTTLTAFGELALSAFANAGAGQPPAPILAAPQQYDQCQGVAPWLADFTATGKGADPTDNREQAIGDYATPGGTIVPFKPNPADQDALTNQISSALAGVKACVFDLAGNIKVDLSQLGRAEIVVCQNLPAGTDCTAELGTVIPLSETDGWRMNTETQLELVGQACQTWRTREANGIKFGFPCEIIIAE